AIVPRERWNQVIALKALECGRAAVWVVNVVGRLARPDALHHFVFAVRLTPVANLRALDGLEIGAHVDIGEDARSLRNAFDRKQRLPIAVFPRTRREIGESR